MECRHSPVPAEGATPSKPRRWLACLGSRCRWHRPPGRLFSGLYESPSGCKAEQFITRGAFLFVPSYIGLSIALQCPNRFIFPASPPTNHRAALQRLQSPVGRLFSGSPASTGDTSPLSNISNQPFFLPMFILNPSRNKWGIYIFNFSDCPSSL